MKLNNKGFSLVEMLAVVAILGILSGLGMIAYSRIVQNSKLDIYLNIVKMQKNAVAKLVNSDEYYAEDDNTVYYFDYRLLDDESIKKSPFADWAGAYVIVTYNGKKYSYYWTGVDKAGWKIDLNKQVDELTRNDIYNVNSRTIIPGKQVGGRDNIVIYDKDGNETSHTPTFELSKEEATKCFTLKSINNNEFAITDYNSKCGTKVQVPSVIEGQKVTLIEENAFRNKGLTEVYLYFGITELKNGAFQDNKISELKLSSTIKTIGGYSFYNNRLTNVTFPEGIERIGEYSFANNQISSLYLSNTLKSIGAYAFYNNRLSGIFLNSNPSIGSASFSRNNMSASSSIIYRFDLNKNATDYSTIIGYGGSEKNVIIPPSVNGVAVTRIEHDAFASCGLTSVSIPDTVTYIGGAAFYNNNLSTIKLPSNLKYIGGQAFRNNYLKKIDIPKSVTTIESGAFVHNSCPQGSDIIYAKKADGSVDYSKIVSGCGGAANTKLVIPSSSHGVKLKTIVGSAFTCSYYTSITLPKLSETDNLTIGTNAFYHNSLSQNDKNAWLYRISNGTVNYEILDSYAGTRPGGEFKIPAEANGVKLKTINASFTWSSFSTIVIPESVTYIANGAFGKGNINNVNFNKIINKTGRKFNWYAITSYSHKNPGTFETGTISHQSGNIEVKK